jgi:Ca2+-binding RTX toxin-like protein
VPNNFDLATLDGSNGFRIDAATRSAVGQIQAAGDINGDGFSDLVITSSNDGQDSFGHEDVNIIFGDDVFGAAVSLGALDGHSGFTLGQRSSTADWQIGAVGDTNGDGFDDLAIGQRYSSYLYLGNGDAQPPAVVFEDAVIKPFTATNWYSGGTSIVGDINSDGLADMRFGDAVVFGRADGYDPTLTAEGLDGSNGFNLIPAYGSAAVQSVVSAGDVNGDGIDDLLIGSPNAYAHGHIDAGEAYVVFGRADGFDPNLDLTTLDGSNGFAVRGDTLWKLGTTVSAAGDVNGDGFDDVLIQSGYRDAYLVFGRATYNGAGFDAASFDGTYGVHIKSSFLYEGVQDVAGIGDFNGDGFSDIAFQTNRGQENGPDISGAQIVYGHAPTSPVTLIDSSGDQTLRGGDFDDIFISYGGDDHLIGGGGNDSLRSIEGTDTMDGRLGDDEYFVFADRSDIIVDAGGNDTIRTTTHRDLGAYADIENAVLATAGDWHLRGNGLDNRLVGSFGDNVLQGEAGNDRLEGGAGNDILVGGSGRDILIGGTGNDRFDFNDIVDTFGDEGVLDSIVDFSAGDLVNLRGMDANSRLNGNQAFNFIGTREFAHNAQQLRYDTHTFTNGDIVTIVEGDINGDGQADFQIEMRGVHALTAGDFIL